MSLEGRKKKKNKNQNCFTKEKKKKNPIIGGIHLQDKTPGRSVWI